MWKALGILVVSVVLFIFAVLFITYVTLDHDFHFEHEKICFPVDKNEAKLFLQEHNEKWVEQYYNLSLIEWKYSINLTEENYKLELRAGLQYKAFHREEWTKAIRFPWPCFSREPLIQRQLKKLTNSIGLRALSDEKYQQLSDILHDIAKIARKNQIICEPQQNSTNPCGDIPDENRKWKSPMLIEWERSLQWVKLIRPLLERTLTYFNEAAQIMGYSDWGRYQRSAYEIDCIEREMMRLWNQILPLYKQLLAYVRKKLILKYTNETIEKDGPLPAHLVESLDSIAEMTEVLGLVPFSNKSIPSITEALVRQNYNSKKLFKLADQFFESLGLNVVPQEFWNNSLFDEPEDREVDCWPNAWDFGNGKDFRIKACLALGREELHIAYHEMGHIQYYMQYAHLPYLLQGGANPAFHEAIGDTIALSITDQHLQRLGFLPTVEEDYQSSINYLFQKGLEKVGALSTYVTIELWRWRIYSGQISFDEANRKFWEFSETTQGIASPTYRSEDYLDAAQNFDITDPYLRYFFSFIIQFQFFEGLCEAAGHKGSLYTCDLTNSKEAGKRMSEAMKLGTTKPWPEVLSILTGGKTDKMDARPLLDYFQPLFEWLEKNNENEFIGWKID